MDTTRIEDELAARIIAAQGDLQRMQKALRTLRGDAPRVGRPPKGTPAAAPKRNGRTWSAAQKRAQARKMAAHWKEKGVKKS